MQQVKPLTKRIATTLAEIGRLEVDLERCNAAIAAGEQPTSALEALRQRRSDEAAQAFVEQRESNVAALDKEIEAAQKVHAAVIAQAAAARDGVRIIEQRLAELRTELASARGDLAVLVQADLGKRLDVAMQRFVDAVDGLREPLAELHAVALTIGDVRGTPGRPGSIAPEVITNHLMNVGLVVPRETGVIRPIWLNHILDDAREKRADLAAELRETGLGI